MKKKRIILVFLFIVILAIVLTSIVVLSKKQDPNIKKTENKKLGRELSNVQKGYFEFTTAIEGISKEDVYYYSDDYFSKSGKEKDEHLRTMSICLALSATDAIDSDDNSSNAKALFKDIGFENIEVADMDKEPTKDTIGSIIASKNVDEKTIIAVSIRGSRYTNEWASNFTAGEEGDIEGFSNASQKIINRIKDYQEKYGIKDSKLWIVGYSRAGAVTNLVGKYINENINEFNTNEDDIYIYTFEAPLSSSSNVIYENIHNIINPYDIITYVYPEKWGLHSNGVEEIIFSESKTIPRNEFYIAQKEIINRLDENGEIETIEIGEFLEDFIIWLTKNSPLMDYSISREKYVMYLQEPFSNIITLYYSKTIDESIQILDFFIKVYQDFQNEGKMDLLIDSFSDFKNNDEDNKKFEPIKNFINEAYEKSDVPLTKEELELIENSFETMSKAVIPIIIMSSLDGNSIDMKITGFYHLATFINNIQVIAENHYPEYNLKLVQENDSYYK